MTVGRSGGLAVGLAILLTAFPPDRLTAQVRVSAGARYSSILVQDSIVTPFTVRPDLAPTLAVSLTLADQLPWRAYLTADGSYSRLRRHESGGTVTDIQGLFAVTLLAEVERPVGSGFDVRAGVGGLLYLTEQSGIFRLGAGGFRPVGGVGARYAPPFLRRPGLALEARYDVHRFNTQALKNAGFLESRWVNRVAIGVSRRIP